MPNFRRTLAVIMIKLLSFLSIFILILSCNSKNQEGQEIDKIVKSEMDLRKEQSEKILDSNNVKINYNLPVIESESETNIRPTKEIAERVTAIAITNIVAFNGLSGEGAIKYMEEFGVKQLLTNSESKFLLNPTEESKIQQTWKAECIWTLMWALNVVPDLKFPEKPCDLNEISQEDYPVNKDKNPNDFINKTFNVRTKKEILDAADLYYRYDWACVDARINNSQIKNLEPSVVHERHYALNWLINYMNLDWDNVTCDT